MGYHEYESKKHTDSPRKGITLIQSTQYFLTKSDCNLNNKINIIFNAV